MKRADGFTLVEVLVVLAIITILAALGLASFAATKGNEVSTGAHLVQDTLNLARQLAVTQNRATEVRFYQTSGTSATSPTFSSLRIEIYDVTGANPVPASALLYLPTGVVMVSDASYSTLLASTNPTAGGTENLPGIGNTLYKAVDFRANGATTLSASGASTGTTTDSWFVSLKMATDPASGGTPAKNFATVQVNPVIGRTLLYRP